MRTFRQFHESKSVEELAKKAKVDIKGISHSQIRKGMDVEKEHAGEKGKDVVVAKTDTDLLKIAVAHLRELPDYYTRLDKIEKS